MMTQRVPVHYHLNIIAARKWWASKVYSELTRG